VNKNVHEIMLITQEECAEVTQAISKVFRFGFSSKHPVTGKSNIDSLEEEVGDLLCMIDLLLENRVIDGEKVLAAKHAKFNKLKTWSNVEVKETQDDA
jgi:NTP pyrophosphatase (non-canonical NTP hydrolase)